VDLWSGRAAVKAGEYGSAEARPVGRALARQDGIGASNGSEPQPAAPYESIGRDSSPGGRAEFARISGEALRSERMMSYAIWCTLRQRGKWEDAQRWFERMVGTVDSLKDGHADFYAAEYLESIGQLEQALAFYNRERARAALPEQSLGALARLSELLGDTVQALRYAHQHDVEGPQHYPETRPLLPGLLARMGRWTEARSSLRAARELAFDRSQRAAWGRLTTEQATVELEQGHSSYALAAVGQRCHEATDPAEREFALQARGIGAAAAGFTARMRRFGLPVSPRPGAAMATEAPRSRPSWPGSRRRVALLGDDRAALGAYERAQVVVDSLADGIADDATRSSTLASLRRVSTRALEIVLARRDRRDAVAQWQRWSGVEEGAHGMRGATRRGVVDPRPRRDRTVVDYVALASTIAALVIGPSGAVITDLGVHPDVGANARQTVRDGSAAGGLVDRRRAARLDTVATGFLSRKLWNRCSNPSGTCSAWRSCPMVSCISCRGPSAGR
jgi:tetratricopeptide (TPR) repeat protein